VTLAHFSIIKTDEDALEIAMAHHCALWRKERTTRLINMLLRHPVWTARESRKLWKIVEHAIPESARDFAKGALLTLPFGEVKNKSPVVAKVSQTCTYMLRLYAHGVRVPNYVV
jgi:hypothetical protein